MSGPAWFATDLDGTLLDALDYSWEAARPALDALRERGLPLALCSSKTRAEMEPLARRLPTRGPLVVENGGAIVDGGVVRALGPPRRRLVAALAEIARETGAGLRGFGSLSAAEVAALTGLPQEGARRALEREYDEPFLLESPALGPAVASAAERRGLRVSEGGRFLHLTGATDKGVALGAWLAERSLASADGIALGDAPNDAPLLHCAARPILVPRGDGRVDPRLRAAFPDAERAPAPGPAGWNVAVLAVLRGERLAQG